MQPPLFLSLVEEAFPCLEELKLTGKNVTMLWQELAGNQLNYVQTLTLTQSYNNLTKKRMRTSGMKTTTLILVTIRSEDPFACWRVGQLFQLLEIARNPLELQTHQMKDVCSFIHLMLLLLKC
ncbi:hypothetical protein Q3G72_023877 [Acer saccharum]|nr:hypothetical protein Q3G72_023877 [Acer saccharum]